MSTQFRSRVKSVVDFGPDLKNVGTCCFTDGTSSALTFYECFLQNGSFIAGENATCPNQGELGTCYACAYLTSSQKQQVVDTNGSVLVSNPTWGTREVTRCECGRVGGQFGATSDPNYPNRDVRLPKACCYFAYNANGFPIGLTCENVCSEKECSLKGITYESFGACCNILNNTCTYGPSSQCNFGGDFPIYKFYPNTECTPNLCLTAPSPPVPRHNPIYTGNKLCSEVGCNESSLSLELLSSMIGENSGLGFEVGPCYELIELDSGLTYSCDLKVLHECSGYWVSPSLSSDILFCDNPYKPQAPQKSSGRVIEPEVMKESDFDALGLSLGDEYKGGYYIGKYSVDGQVFGSLNLTSPEERYYEDVYPRDEYKKWALIVDFNDYAFSVMNRGELDFSAPRTSHSDGFYNCYGNKTSFSGINTTSINTVANTKKNGFKDFYIPSILELYYLSYIVKNNPELAEKLSVNGSLTSSTIFFEDITSAKTEQYNFNGTVFMYGQTININEFNFGRTGLVPGYQKSYIRLFRKIILT
jgi:hypothetical protein